MGHHGHHDDIVPPKKFELGGTFMKVCIACIVTGVIAFAVGLSIDATAAWKGYIIGLWFTLGLGLIGPFFAATQHMPQAGWSVSLRRIVEAYGAYIYVAAAFAIAGAFLIPDSVFIWQHPQATTDPIFAKKAGFLNKSSFLTYTCIVFALWSGVYFLMRHLSVKQDKESGFEGLYKLQQVSALYLISFAGGVSFMAWFWIMSLEPNWFSTMFSVYTFSGMFQSGLALTYILMIKLGREGYFGSFMGGRQVHELGKMVFGFTVFYAYIGFCQFMLIWYANIPEEDVWYLQRIGDSGWLVFTLALPFLKFIFPFLIMLPQKIKKNSHNVMYFLCFFLIAMQLFEVWYWVAPEPHGLVMAGAHGAHHAAHHGPHFGHTLMQLCISLGFIGTFGIVAGKAFANQNIIPVGDPYLHETLPGFTHEPLLMDEVPTH